METFVKLVTSLLKFLLEMMDMGGMPDKYVVVGMKPANSEEKVIPFARTDVPYLGEDHEQLIAKAERLYSDDALRYKWLMAIYKVRQTSSGWILDKKSKQNRPKWGLTHIAA